MGFYPVKSRDGAVIPFEYRPVSAITPKLGMAMVESGGKLAIATGTTKPTYISMVEKDAACTAGELIPVIRIDPETIYETNFSADASDIKLGDRVTLHASDGMQVTATTTSGVAEVVEMEGTDSGSVCRVRF